MKDKRKNKTKRSKTEYPDLNKKVNTKIRQLYMDQDYLHKLSPKELKFLNKFMKEELNTNFTHTNQDFNKTAESKKKLYNDNNSRNRCIFNQLKSSNNLNYLGDMDISTVIKEDNIDDVSYLEDVIIEYIDSKKEIDAIAESTLVPEPETED